MGTYELSSVGNGRLAGYCNDPADDECYVDCDEITGEAQVLTRGIAYSIAGVANALCLFVFMAISSQ